MSDWSLMGGGSDTMAIGIVAASSKSTTLTSGATANTKGSWVELSASTPAMASGFYVRFIASTRDYLIDIAIGAAGFEQAIVENLYCGNGSASRLGETYSLPVQIPAGSRVSARCQDSSGGSTVDAPLLLLRGGLLLPASAGRVTPYGANLADSGGVQVDPGATANTKGAYSEIVASLANPIKGLILAFGTMASTTRASAFWLVDIAVGAAGSEQILIPDFQLGCNSAGAKSVMPQTSPLIPLSIPAGTRLSARAQCDITTAGTAGRLFDIIAYGID